MARASILTDRPDIYLQPSLPASIVSFLANRVESIYTLASLFYSEPEICLYSFVRIQSQDSGVAGTSKVSCPLDKDMWCERRRC